MTECQEMQGSLSAHIDGALSEQEAARLDEHLAGCLDCQGDRVALEQVAEQVRALPRLEVPAQFTAGVMARVVEEPSVSSAPATPKKMLVAKLVEPTGDVQDLILPDVSEDSTPSVCAQLAEDRSALLDRALSGTATTRVKEHLAECEACRADQVALQRLRDRVGAVPRMAVSPDFVLGVMDKVDAYEFSRQVRAQQARDARAKWLKTMGGLAHAASFLLILAGGIYFASPDTPYRVRLQPGFKSFEGAGEDRAEAPPPPAPAPSPLPRADAEWELNVASLEQGHQTTRTLANRFARFRDERAVQSEEQRTSGFLLNVARNQIDDLHASLDNSQDVQTNAQSQDETQRFHTEQDQVVLKSGFVLVGQMRRDDRQGVQIITGGSMRLIPKKDVERIERANETKTLRILLHERD